MSLYNMLFKVEPTAGVALALLGIRHTEVARFRDAYFTWDDAEQTDPVIWLLTRTGGGGRAVYDMENQRLRQIAGYRRDFDEPFDLTFASFVFDVPANARPSVSELLNEYGPPLTLREKFDQLWAIQHNAAETEPA